MKDESKLLKFARVASLDFMWILIPLVSSGIYNTGICFTVRHRSVCCTLTSSWPRYLNFQNLGLGLHGHHKRAFIVFSIMYGSTEAGTCIFLRVIAVLSSINNLNLSINNLNFILKTRRKIVTWQYWIKYLFYFRKTALISYALCFSL